MEILTKPENTDTICVTLHSKKGKSAMRNGFFEELDKSNRIHIPLPVDHKEYAEERIRGKKATETICLSDCSSLERWHVDTPAEMEVSRDYSEHGETSIRFVSPTRLEYWPESYGRIYATPYLTCLVPEMDLTDYQRISVCIRPEMQGFKQVSLHLQLVNEGEHPIPDRYMREGCHNMNLKNHQWNRMTVEIPHVYRDKVTAVKIGYDMVGNEREATDTACFYIKDIEAQKIKCCEEYKGWVPQSGKLVYSGSGYQISARKCAFGAADSSDHFKVINAETGRVAVEKETQFIRNTQGDFAIMDFTELEEPGKYILLCGEVNTRVFEIGDEIWEDAIWKCVNFFFCERCGYEVPGIHKYCHGNVVSHYQGKSIISNGGWHDAADMSQNLTNTADAVYALFCTADKMKENQALFDRLVEEGKWGLDWLLRTRFENGYRTTGSGGSVWTGNILGDCDEMDNDAQRLAIENFMAAAAEALASGVLREIDREQSDYLKKVAAEDWNYAYEDIEKEQYVATMDPARVSSPVLLYSAGVIASCELYRITGEKRYENKAEELAERMMSCQQTEYPDWDVPLTGFFYRDEKKSQIQHYNHRCYEHVPVMAFQRLLENFKESPKWMKWYHGSLLYTEYIKEAVKITAPYGMAPASIYHVGEAEADKELFLAQQAFAHEGMLDEYVEQVENGVRLGKGYYLKRFPVWFSYRGNNGLVLSFGSAAAIGAEIRNDPELQQIAREQMEWTIGKNPFGQSLMMGEGYEYAEQYVCLPGEISGGICVGIQSFENTELPYWSQCNNATYREVWIHPVIRFLLAAGSIQGDAVVNGCLKGGSREVLFVRKGSGVQYRVDIEPVSGYFKTRIPAGEYRIVWGEKEKPAVFLNHGKYEIQSDFSYIEAGWKEDGEEIVISVSGKGEGISEIRFDVDNIEMETAASVRTGETRQFRGVIRNKRRPWLVSVVPNGKNQERIDLYPQQKGGM